VTDDVTSIIGTTGGYLSQSNMLSNYATVLVLEDVDPHRLGPFTTALSNVPSLQLTSKSLILLESCQRSLLDSKIPKPATMVVMLHLIWRGADGSLTHTKLSDG
jgi:hypothetical protein